MMTRYVKQSTLNEISKTYPSKDYRLRIVAMDRRDSISILNNDDEMVGYVTVWANGTINFRNIDGDAHRPVYPATLHEAFQEWVWRGKRAAIRGTKGIKTKIRWKIYDEQFFQLKFPTAYEKFRDEITDKSVSAIYVKPKTIKKRTAPCEVCGEKTEQSLYCSRFVHDSCEKTHTLWCKPNGEEVWIAKEKLAGMSTLDKMCEGLLEDAYERHRVGGRGLMESDWSRSELSWANDLTKQETTVAMQEQYGEEFEV